ncbi:MAG: class I adenylate-forming enzyme family protein, partial [Pseudomonadota bacterium]
MDSIYEKRPWLKNYPEWVPHDLQAGPATAIDDFRNSAAQRPDAPAVCYFDGTLSYGEIDRLSNSLAAAFYDLGARKGDRIIVCLQNVPQFLIAVYAAWKIGAIVVPLNPMYKEKELSYFCRDSGAKLFVVLDELLSALDQSFLKETCIKKVITTSALDFLSPDKDPPGMLKGAKRMKIPGAADMLDLLSRFTGEPVQDQHMTADDVAYLTYTSGTTGPPKGAMNTHGNIAFNARVYQKMQCIDENDVVLGVA